MLLAAPWPRWLPLAATFNTNHPLVAPTRKPTNACHFRRWPLTRTAARQHGADQVRPVWPLSTRTRLFPVHCMVLRPGLLQATTVPVMLQRLRTRRHPLLHRSTLHTTRRPLWACISTRSNRFKELIFQLSTRARVPLLPVAFNFRNLLSHWQPRALLPLALPPPRAFLSLDILLRRRNMNPLVVTKEKRCSPCHFDSAIRRLHPAVLHPLRCPLAWSPQAQARAPAPALNFCRRLRFRPSCFQGPAVPEPLALIVISETRGHHSC